MTLSEMQRACNIGLPVRTKETGEKRATEKGKQRAYALYYDRWVGWPPGCLLQYPSKKHAESSKERPRKDEETSWGRMRKMGDGGGGMERRSRLIGRGEVGRLWEEEEGERAGGWASSWRRQKGKKIGSRVARRVGERVQWVVGGGWGGGDWELRGDWVMAGW